MFNSSDKASSKNVIISKKLQTELLQINDYRQSIDWFQGIEKRVDMKERMDWKRSPNILGKKEKPHINIEDDMAHQEIYYS